MMNTKRNRGGRMNSGRQDKRQIYQDRQRPRGPVNKNVYIDGVYKNPRFTHVVISLVGTTVQVQVKNGKVYEGILKTVSNKGDTVLEMAHVVEDNMGSGTIGLTTPSRDRIVDKLIIEVSDLVAINAANVDLDFAVKDAFTDTGISKFNGDVKEKEMRELQPWEADSTDEIGCLEGDRSNGWDAHEMFQTNANMYNVKSSYDESLGQYTTKLNRDNSEEYRRREEEASRLAAEIERSEMYKKHIALENGEGDDEEATFSSVVRPGGDQHPNPTGAGGPGKYIPPNKRPGVPPGMQNKPMGRGYAHPPHQNAPPPQQQQPPHPQQHGPPHHPPHGGPPGHPPHSQQHGPPHGPHHGPHHGPPGHQHGPQGLPPPQHQQHQPHGPGPIHQQHGPPHQQHGPPHQPHGGQHGGQQPHGQPHGPPHAGQPSVSRSMVAGHRQSPPVTQNANSQSSVETVSINGEKPGRPSIPASTAGPTIKTSSPVQPQQQQQQQQSGSPTPTAEAKHEHNPQFPPGKPDTKKKGRDEQIKELKEFSSNFKLDDNKETKEKDKEKDKGSNSDSGNKETAGNKDNSHNPGHEDKENKETSGPTDKSSDDATSPTSDKMSKLHVSEDSSKTPESSDSSQEKAGDGDAKSKDVPVIKSTLNPNAMAFTPKSFPPKQTSQQTPPPPRPQTQSPIIQQAPMLAQPVYPAPGQQYIMSHNPAAAMVLNNQPNVPSAAASQQQQQIYRPKRAVVSVKPDYTASAVQAATGQPLLAQSAGAGYMYIPQQMMPPQPTGYQMGQMMPMPAAQTTPRFMTPTSMQGMPPTSLQAGLEQNTPSAGQAAAHMYMHQQGPMPAHMNPAAASHMSHPGGPGHMGHINMSSNTQQQQPPQPPQSSQPLNPPLPSAGSAPTQPHQHHPAPSPVLNNPNQQQMNSGPHPPSSGTPQPPQGYPQATLQAPPLQPSPHNPTSPQNMQPMPYYNTSHPLQMQSSAGGGGSVGGGGMQFSMPQPSSGQSSVTYSMHSHQSPHMQQIVMMPHQQMSASGQLNHPHPHIHGSHQFPGHPMAGPGSMQQQLMSQSAAAAVSGLHGQNPGGGPGQGPHPQHQMQQHFLPQGLTAAAALTNALHTRQDHFIMQHLRKQ